MTGNIPAVVCWKCKKPIEASDVFCRFCAAHQRRDSGGFFFSHSGVWIMFLLLGPLNLWFIWQSTSISRAWKIIYTFISVVLTIVVCWVIYVMAMRIINMYSTIFNMS